MCKQSCPGAFQSTCSLAMRSDSADGDPGLIDPGQLIDPGLGSTVVPFKRAYLLVFAIPRHAVGRLYMRSPMLAPSDVRVVCCDGSNYRCSSIL